MDYFAGIIVGLFILINLYNALILIMVNINAKFILFKEYRHQRRWLLILLVIFVIEIIILAYFQLQLQWLFLLTLFAIILNLTIQFYYIETRARLNKKRLLIDNFSKIDFAAMIEKTHIATKKALIEQILKTKKNSFQTLAEHYEMLCFQITEYNGKNFLDILAKLIKFNNGIKLFNYRYNQIIYKFSLYLYMDFNNILRTYRQSKTD